LIIPVGPAGEQDLVRVTRTADGFVREQLSSVSFVPLVEGTG
jgi:protein-L-isoaspartate O-methyltransferase